MKRIGLTQRVDFVNAYKEKRDALDQNWYSFCDKINGIPIPLPNLKKNINKFLLNLKIDILILTGGNSICLNNKNFSGSSKQRDQFELKVIEFAIKNKIPIIGVCRGMQILNIYFGGSLKKIKNHVNKKHCLYFDKKNLIIPKNVNSFHEWSIPINYLGKNLIPLAYDNKNNVEFFKHKNNNILGMMWHPERDRPFNKKNINLIKKFTK